MVTNHLDCERGNPLLPHGLLTISSKGSFIYGTPSDKQDSIYHGLS